MHAMIDYEFKTGQVFTKMESQEPLHDQIKISMSLFRLYLMSGSFNPWKIPLWSSWAFLVKRVLIRRTRAIFGFLAAAGVIATVALGDNSTFAPHPSHPLNAKPPHHHHHHQEKFQIFLESLLVLPPRLGRANGKEYVMNIFVYFELRKIPAFDIIAFYIVYLLHMSIGNGDRLFQQN